MHMCLLLAVLELLLCGPALCVAHMFLLQGRLVHPPDDKQPLHEGASTGSKTEIYGWDACMQRTATF